MRTTQINHPGITLKEAIDARRLSQRAVARQLGISQPALSNIMTGKFRLSPVIAIRIEQHIGLSAAALLHAQTDFDIAEARVRVAAGAMRQKGKQTLVTSETDEALISI
jgi:addiction module HigA family antidote